MSEVALDLITIPVVSALAGGRGAGVRGALGLTPDHRWTGWHSFFLEKLTTRSKVRSKIMTSYTV